MESANEREVDLMTQQFFGKRSAETRCLLVAGQLRNEEDFNFAGWLYGNVKRVD